MDRSMRTGNSGALHARGRFEREIRKTRRHSRIVALLKVGLPLTAVVIVAGGVAVTWLARSVPEDVTVGSVGFEDGQIVMEDPRMSGTDGNNRPYSMIAQRAVQSLTGGGIDLERVEATISVSEKVTADIVAAKGHYDQQAEKLRLFDNITVNTSDGMSMRLREADIDLAAGTMTGGGAIEIDTPSQTVRAGSLDVKEGGALLSFGNHVTMTLLPATGGEAGQKLSERK